MLIAKIDNGNEIYFYQRDHLGSTRAVTDAQGAIVGQYDYEPFGTVSSQEGLSETYRFTGKPEDDDVTGLYYYGARYYDPQTGRFISVDPARDGLNWYVYCYNNPMKYIDPNGEVPLVVVTGGVGAAVGAGIGGYISYKSEGNINWRTVGKGALVGGAVGIGMGAGASLIASQAMGGSTLGLTAAQTLSGFTSLVKGGVSATKWGVSASGINQGIKHFFEYAQKNVNRLEAIARNLNVNPESFSLTKQGFTNFTNAAMRVKGNGQMKQMSNNSVAYFYKNVIVIIYNGKLQSMMPSGIKYFNKL